MKVFCFFVEPASYSIDLGINVYDKHKIDYCFMNSTSLAASELLIDKDFLENKSLLYKIRYTYDKYRTYDFIIVNGYNNIFFILNFLFVLFSRNKKYVAIESDTQFLSPNNIIIRLVKWIYLSVIFSNKYILGFAGGNFVHKDLFRNYGMPEDRISLMPMMVNNCRFFCEDKIFPDKFTFLFVGRIVKYKGVEQLINEFIKRFHDKNAILKIVGSGIELQNLKKKYASSKVIFLGKKSGEDLVKEFHNASCFVCPSIFEPWGLVINEALSSSLPVIVTKEVGASYDLVKDRGTGFVVDNIEEFGHKMLVLFNDKHLLYEFSSNAAKLMREYWNYALYVKCLKNIVNRPSV